MRPTMKQVSFGIQLPQAIAYVRGQRAIIQLEDITAQLSARVAPVRPRFSSVGSDEENEGSDHGKLLNPNSRN